MDRRTFLAGTGAVLLAAPLAAKAQLAGKMFRIGALGVGLPELLRQSLREVGYVEGLNLAIEWRDAEGKTERFGDLAAELVRLKVDMIVASNPAATFAAKRSTASIPIVMVNNAFAAMTRERAGAVLVLADPMTFFHRTRLAELAAKRRLPAMYGVKGYIDAGGLMSYWAHQGDLYRRVGCYVDRLLKGAKPADLPIEQPTKFELVINLKTAKALGLTIPQSLLSRADEVIQ
jgi:ABC-type uncharacterized transport system substrate-binding protein